MHDPKTYASHPIIPIAVYARRNHFPNPIQSIWKSSSFLDTSHPTYHLLDPLTLVPLLWLLLVPRLLRLSCVLLELSEPIQICQSNIQLPRKSIKTHCYSYTPYYSTHSHTHSRCSSRSVRPDPSSISTARPAHPVPPQHPPTHPIHHRCASQRLPSVGWVVMCRTMSFLHHRNGGVLR